MNVLFILGQNETVADPGWQLPAAFQAAFPGTPVRIREQAFANSGPNVCTMDDLNWTDVVYCYSHGMWTIKELTGDFATNPTWKLLVGVLPVVTDDGLGGNDIYVPASVRQVVVYQVTPPKSVPVSVPVKPSDGVQEHEVWFDFGQPDGEVAILALDTNAFLPGPIGLSTTPNPNYGKPLYPRININCNSLATSWNPVSNHIDTPNHPDLIATQIRIHGELFGAQS